MGAGSRRDSPDAPHERPPIPRRPPSRRTDPIRPRRPHRRSPGCRRVRHEHRPSHRPRLHHDAQVPSQHLPCRRSPLRTPSFAPSSTASPSTSSTTSSWSPRTAATSSPSSAYAPCRRPSDALTSSTLTQIHSRTRPSSSSSNLSYARQRPLQRPLPLRRIHPPGLCPPEPTRQYRHQRRRCRPARHGQEPSTSPTASSTPSGLSAPPSVTRSPFATRRQGSPTTPSTSTSRAAPDRVSAPSSPAESAFGSRRLQRLRRQRTQRGTAHHLPAQELRPRLRLRRQRHRRKRLPLRRHFGSRLLPRTGSRAIRGAQLGSDDGDRGSGRPRLRVHDGRSRRHPGPRGSKLRGGDVGRVGVRVRPTQQLCGAVQSGECGSGGG